MKTYLKILLLLTGTLVGMAIIFTFIVYPSLTAMKEMSKETYLIRKDLEIKYERGQRIRKTTDDLRKIEPEISHLSAVYIKEGEELNFINLLEQLAQQNYLEQKINWNFKKEEVGTKIIAVPIEINLQGDFINVLKYLSALEQTDYYINFYDFTFGPTTSAKNSSLEETSLTPGGAVQAILKGKVYWGTNSSS